MTQYALRLANDTDTAARVRMADALPFLSAAGKRGARSGLRNDGGGVVSVNAGTMQVAVSPFSALVNGGASDAQGPYAFVSDDSVTFTLADGDATQDRVDTIAAVIADDSADGSGETAASLQVIQGTPGGGAPDLPATSLPIQDVTVPATASAGTGGLSSSALTADRRAYLAMGIMRVSGGTERDALAVAAGTAIYRVDTRAVEVWNGAAWEAYKKGSGVQSGTVTTSSIQANANWQTVATVTFATAFSGAPAVTLTNTTGHGGTPIEWGVVSISATSFGIRALSPNSSLGTQTLCWIAAGPA